MTELSALRSLARDYYFGVIDQPAYRAARTRLLDEIAGQAADDDDEPTRPQDRRYTEDRASSQPIPKKRSSGLALAGVLAVLGSALAAWWVLSS